MKHQDVHELGQLADISDARLLPSRRERLERWVEVLQRNPQSRLQTLGEIEWQPRAARPLMRAENSPLTVAFGDPLLRAAGLRGDRLGDAMDFFELSEREVHMVLCSCMHGANVQSGSAARYVGDIARSERVRAGGVWALIALPVVGSIGYAIWMAAQLAG